MKSLKDYSLKLSELDYHNYPAWSYSLIAKYAKEGFGAIATLHDKVEATSSMEFGSLLDSILTRGKTATQSRYAVYEGSIPAAEKKVLDYIVSLHSEAKHLSDVSPELITQATDACQYYSKWGYDAKFKHLAEYNSYFELANSGKQIVSNTDWNDAMEMASKFRTDQYLKDLFGIKNTKDVEYLYQTQFLIDYELSSGETVKIKIMPDLIKVNHKEKTIQLVDLKTSAIPAWSFKDNFIKFRYDIQAHLYSYVVGEIIKSDNDLKDYTILPYLFSDISRSDKVPVTYMYDQTDFSQINGFSYTIGDRTYQYKNWQTLLEEIISYEKSSATVPSYIRTDIPNNILDIISIS